MIWTLFLESNYVNQNVFDSLKLYGLFTYGNLFVESQKRFIGLSQKRCLPDTRLDNYNNNV